MKKKILGLRTSDMNVQTENKFTLLLKDEQRSIPIEQSILFFFLLIHSTSGTQVILACTGISEILFKILLQFQTLLRND